MRFDVLTLFPAMFTGVLGTSILRRAADAGAASYHLHDIRNFSEDPKHQKVDAPPYGGGPGMVMQCGPVAAAVSHAEALADTGRSLRVMLTPKGRPLTQKLAEHLATLDRLVLICGHYEGFDQRVIDHLHEMPPATGSGAAGEAPTLDDADTGHLLELSVGDYVLSGGELPAMVLIDAVVRLLPGAIGDAASHDQDSFSPGADRLLDHPHYTRPPVWNGRAVPDVLTGGNHADIATWRHAQATALTRTRRPDLLGGGSATNASRGAVSIHDAADLEPDALRALLLRLGCDGARADAAAAAVDRRQPFALLLAHDASRAHPTDPFAAGEPIGLALITHTHPADQPAARGFLAVHTLIVHPDHRRRGLGRALLRTAARQGVDAAATALFLGDLPDAFRRGCGLPILDTPAPLLHLRPTRPLPATAPA